MAAMEAANPHQQQHGNHQPYPSLPASPTLTNPDMILPDYGRTDSPDTDIDHRNSSPLTMWKNSHAAAAAVAAGDLHQMLSGTSGIPSLDHPYGPTGPVTPTTPIIYGNGTMLSDIGEVTEVESTPGKPSPARNKVLARRQDSSPTRNSGSDAALRSSPTIGVNAMLQKKSKQSLLSQRTRRSSVDSNSTVTTQRDQAAAFADFDDSVSVGDSVFQGDDEESLASSYVEGTAARESTRLGVPGSENLDRLSTYSTYSTYSATSLSRRAEEILANAKKRLTTMEGNLNRARTTFSPTSVTYGSDASTPSPPFQRSSTAMYSRDPELQSPISPGHSRMSSDIATGNGLPSRVSAPRSQSAMGAAGGYRQSLSFSKSADPIRGEVGEENVRPVYKISPPPTDLGQQHLTEEEVEPLDEPASPTNSARLSQFLSPTFGVFPGDAANGGGRGLQRSASAAQMRDIKDQMKDLKGKISSLREQARTDSIKRRSLQSLRTPSPFTHAQIDQWYAEPKSNRSSGFTADSVPPNENPWTGEEPRLDEKGKGLADEADLDAVGDEFDAAGEPEVEAQRQLAVRTPEHPAAVLPGHGYYEGEDDRSDVVTEIGDEEESTEDYQTPLEDDYMSESGESLYHDTVQHPISHEDREDAFDYEHFFLHSAMGSMSRSLARRGSTDSYTSEDSIETTRGPIQGRDSLGSHKSGLRSRRDSTGSVSTIETFATAEEGRSRKSMESRGEADIADAMPEDHRSHSRASAGMHRPESKSRHSRPSSSADTARTDNGATISGGKVANSLRDGDMAGYSTIPEEGSDYHDSESAYRVPTARRPMPASGAASLHRPSVSSFDSTGTSRSFPLVNKPRRPTSTGILTPTSSSPDPELKSISSTLLNEAANLFEQQQQETEGGRPQDRGRPFGHGSSVSLDMARGPGGLRNPDAPLALQTLMREDKYLVERLVASLGRCVLGLTENGRASAESRMYRRRIDAARRILEGIEQAEP
ncbi:hypothetical protein V8F33_007635 [Rhypophila sp. PSN 637]